MRQDSSKNQPRVYLFPFLLKKKKGGGETTNEHAHPGGPHVMGIALLRH